MDTTALRAAVATMETALGNLATELAAAASANAANPKASYTISTLEGSQSVDWNGFREAISNQMAALVKNIGEVRALINAYDPYNIATRMYMQ